MKMMSIADTRSMNGGANNYGYWYCSKCKKKMHWTALAGHAWLRWHVDYLKPLG